MRLFIVCFFFTFSLSAQLKWDSLILENKLEDGLIPGVFYGEFKFQNIGKKPIEIISVKGWCSCAKITLDRYIYKEGEFGTIPYKISLVGKGANFNKNIRVTTNLGKTYHLKFKMIFPKKFEVAQLLSIVPELKIDIKYDTDKKIITPKTKVPPSARKPLKRQQTCPFQQKKIKRQFYVDYNGMRIYSCCQECLPAIKSKPELAISNLKLLGQYACSIKRAIAIETALKK